MTALPHNGTPTSRAAAASMVTQAGVDRQRILDELTAASVYGLTCDEIEQWLGLKHQTASARLYDLRHAKDIVDSHRTRATRSGRAAIVWILATLAGAPS